MRNFILAFAMGLLPASAYAQEASPEPDPIQFANPEHNLDCAVFILSLIQRGAAKGDDRSASAAPFFMYFVGRYEGSADAFIEDALIERIQNMEADDLAETSLKCLPEVAALTVKLQGYSEFFKGQQEAGRTSD